jgi:hypothetical protein
VEQDPNLTSGQRATFENELAADIVSYATSGTPTCLTAQFAKVQSWARANHINTGEILVGEYGVAQPSHHALGDPLPTSPAWFSALLSAVHRVGFAATVCAAYEDVFP